MKILWLLLFLSSSTLLARGYSSSYTQRMESEATSSSSNTTDKTPASETYKSETPSFRGKVTQKDSAQAQEKEKESDKVKKEKEEKEKKEKEKKEKEKKEKEKKEKEKKEKEKKKKEEEAPWFLGTLLASFASNTDPGRLLVEPSVYIAYAYGDYDQKSNLVRDRDDIFYTYQLYVATGITKEIDISITLTSVFVDTPFGSSSNWADTALQFGFQITRDIKDSWIPDIRILATEIFPTGKFENLDPLLNFSDDTGNGSYQSTLMLAFEKTFYGIPNHPWNFNVNIGIAHSSGVKVNGFSAFGGGPNTKGRVFPGERFVFNLCFEYKFDKNWGAGIDIHYIWQTRSTFHSFREEDVIKGIPSSSQFSLAPQVEYNINEDYAFLFALWYTLFGRNSTAFFSGAFLLSMQF